MRKLVFNNPQILFYLHGVMVGFGMCADVLLGLQGNWWAWLLLAGLLWAAYSRFKDEHALMVRIIALAQAEAYAKGLKISDEVRGPAGKD